MAEEEKAAAPPPPPPPSEPQAPEDKASGKAIAALVIGIVSVVVCCLSFVGPVAWILGSQERKAIREGRSSKKGETLALVGMILGIVGTIFFILLILYIVFMGGLAMLSNFSSGGY